MSLHGLMTVISTPLEAFLKPHLLFGFDVGVLTEDLQVSTKNPERKVSDEFLNMS